MSEENLSNSVHNILQRISAKTSDLLVQLDDVEKSDADKDASVREHLESDCYKLGDDGKISDCLNVLELSFDNSCEWINSRSPTNVNEESSSKILVLEFFTHCCINCIHSIEDVRQVFEGLRQDLQQKNPTDRFCDIKLISVHSPKFTREKDNESVKSFAKRMNMNHSEVVNDPNNTLWNKFGIFCWPTLLIFGPNPKGTGPNLIHVLMGEGHRKRLQILLKSALNYFDEKLDFQSIQMNISLNSASITATDEVDMGSSSILKYPGKVVCYGSANLIAIADSGNNRVIISSRNGTVKDIIGGVDRGMINGNFDEARFYNPQGIAFQDDEVLYIADTGNHAVRKVNLKTRTVTTLVSSEVPIDVEGKAVTLKSPWDLSFYDKDVLLVAAAGNHRIFAYFFADLPLFGVEHEANSFAVVAGSGREENRNNAYILKASFAQPSGIACSQGLNENDKIVYIADSESSTIRYISGGRVMGLVGGNRDPSDLFAYGDVDGCFLDVKLQHPMGVCSGMGASKIFIADTYNHKVKMIDVESKHATTLIGTGVAGPQVGSFSGYVTPKKRINTELPSGDRNPGNVNYALLNEPGGICIDDQYGLLYIADTNNHMIKIGDIRRKIVTELELKFADSVPATPPVKTLPTEPGFPWDQEYSLKLPIHFKTLKLELSVNKVPDSYEGGEWRIKSPSSAKDFAANGQLEKQGGDAVAKVSCNNVPLDRDLEGTEFYMTIDIFFCGSSSCYRKRLNLHFNVTYTSPNEENDSSHATDLDDDVVLKQFHFEPVSRTHFME